MLVTINVKIRENQYFSAEKRKKSSIDVFLSLLE